MCKPAVYSVYFPAILKYKVIMCYKILHVIFYENSLNQHKENGGFIFATFRTKRVKSNLLEMDL